MGAVPSVPTDRSRTLKVIGAGYSRTGTLSMALALEKLLDGPVMHGGSQLLGREDAYVKIWSQVFTAHDRGDKPLLLKLLREATAGFVAITDAPGNCFIGELVELYPEAEVVCVKRDREKWWKSWNGVLQQAEPGYLKWVLAPVPGRRWFMTLAEQFLRMQEERFGPNAPDRMDEHNKYAKQVTPAEKFHMMELKEGWEPLCKILSKPVPSEPFPRVNDGEAVKELEYQILKDAATTWAGIFAVVGVLGSGVWWTWNIMML